MDDEMGDYERFVLGVDRRTDPEAWTERQLAAADHDRKAEREGAGASSKAVVLGEGRRESWIAGAPNRATVERDGDRRNRPSHLGLTSTTPPEFRDMLIATARFASVQVAA